MKIVGDPAHHVFHTCFHICRREAEFFAEPSAKFIRILGGLHVCLVNHQKIRAAEFADVTQVLRGGDKNACKQKVEFLGAIAIP